VGTTEREYAIGRERWPTATVVQRRTLLLDVILAGPEVVALRGPPELDGKHAVVVFDVSAGPKLDRMEALLGATLWTIRYQSVIAAVPFDAQSGRAHPLERVPDAAAAARRPGRW
jgi:hypothetical protein